MKKKIAIGKYFSIIILKLALLALLIVSLNVVILFLIIFVINYNIRDLPQLTSYIVMGIPFLPFFFFLFFYLINMRKTNLIDKLAFCRYNIWFPYYYYFTKNPKANPKIDIDKIKENFQSCDIILRRYRNYLDGIIFSENSYFTHVGICYRENDQKPFEVLHATGEEGVHRTPLDEFCKCDSVAILRFSLQTTIEEMDIRNHIKTDNRTIANLDIKKDELEIFDYLIKKTQSEINETCFSSGKIFSDHYSQTVINRALSLVGTKYDFSFNFDNFCSFSCIEYVWYCFKCLFPLHRIRVKDFEFFNWIKMPIIIPDVFIKNDFFQLIYTSLTKINNQSDNDAKNTLKKYIKKKVKKDSLLFLFNIALWNVIVMISFLCTKLWLKL